MNWFVMPAFLRLAFWNLFAPEQSAVYKLFIYANRFFISHFKEAVMR